MMNQAPSIAMGNRYARAVYLDMEWTCWDSTPPQGMQQEIIEIGVVSMDLNELRIVDECSYFVRPRRWEISLKCTQLTGISHQDVLGARSLREVLAVVSERFQPERVPCCAWGEDVSILAKACRTYGLSSPFGRAIDLSVIFQGLFATEERVGLKKATEMLGIGFDGFAHGALPDARNTALVHQSLLRRMLFGHDGTVIPPVDSPQPNTLSSFAQKLSESLHGV